VAAQLCGDRRTVESLGYKVDDEGVICQQQRDENGKAAWKPFSKLGSRRAVLNDLSPAATFIAYNYNTPVDVQAFEREAKRILKEVEAECGWMYRTLHSFTSTKEHEEEIRKVVLGETSCPSWITLGTINYTVWSDVFICSECTQEVVFWEAAVDKKAGKVHDEFPCPHCGVILTKRRMDRAWVTKYDKAIQQTIRQAKQVPVLINYSLGKKRYEKAPDAFDLALIEKIEELDIPYWFPTDRMPEGDESRRNDDIGLTHVHHFYTKRNLWVLGGIRCKTRIPQCLLMFNSQLVNISKLNRYRPEVSFPYNPLSGTLYVGSQVSEANVLTAYENKIIRISNALYNVRCRSYLFTQSSEHTWIASNSVDYIFTDPPFGGNLMYSELNFLWEAWLKVFTNNKPEAIENKVQGKGLAEYQKLMTECFNEYYRVLKPGRWMTVEFHNSKNSVWNSIQEALQTAGFVIADVRTLDKQQGSFKQVTSASAVKQDLIISCYKPNGGLEERFKLEAGTEEGVWDFIRTHMKQLPVFVSKDGQAEIVVERQNYLLFDRMVAFHVQRGVTVPLSAAEFYAGIAQRFPERDGMYFLPEQVAEYDKKRMTVREVLQLQLFVIDESSAIQWLKQQLTRKPQTFQEIHPQFLREIGGWQKYEKPLELSELLEQNFLRYDGKGPIPAQLVSWLKQSEEMRKAIQDALASGEAIEENGALVFSSLSPQSSLLITRSKDRWYVPDPNKAGDLEKLRERSLLKEFEDYRTSNQRKLKVFRLEAVRAGFKKAWQERDYATIITVARKIPENILQEDPKLLMWYDQALTRSGEA
jgi:DNA-directed RNA polymerase subunit RPC12/RpoP